MKVFINELSTLHKLTPNGNNLPFQIKWKDNQTINKQTKRDAFKQVLTALDASVKLSIEAHSSRSTIIEEVTSW